jgi:hypothetical protein
MPHHNLFLGPSANARFPTNRFNQGFAIMQMRDIQFAVGEKLTIRFASNFIRIFFVTV